MPGRVYKEYYNRCRLWTFKKRRKTPVSVFHLHSELTGNLFPFVPCVIFPYLPHLMSNILSRVNVRGKREIFLTWRVYCLLIPNAVKYQRLFFLVKIKRNSVLCVPIKHILQRITRVKLYHRRCIWEHSQTYFVLRGEAH